MARVEAGPWHIEPQLWDRLTIEDEEWPGLATVEISRGNKWDEKKAKGSHGAKREYAGAELAKVKITIEYWTASDHQAITTKHLPKIEPVPGKKKIDAVKLGHAVAIARNVSAITIDKVSGPNWAAGVATIEIEATEHREPEKRNATGLASGGGRANLAKSCQELSRVYADYKAKENAAGAEAQDLYAQLSAKGGEFGLSGTNASGTTFQGGEGTLTSSQGGGGGNADLAARARAKEREAEAWRGLAATVYSQMLGSGCANSPPSGSSTTTGPDSTWGA